MTGERDLRAGFINTVARLVTRSADRASDHHTRSTKIREDLEIYATVFGELGLFPNIIVRTDSGTEKIPGLIVYFDPEKRKGVILGPKGELLHYRVQKSPIMKNLSHPLKGSLKEIAHKSYKKYGEIALRNLANRLDTPDADVV